MRCKLLCSHGFARYRRRRAFQFPIGVCRYVNVVIVVSFWVAAAFATALSARHLTIASGPKHAAAVPMMVRRREGLRNTWTCCEKRFECFTPKHGSGYVPGPTRGQDGQSRRAGTQGVVSTRCQREREEGESQEITWPINTVIKLIQHPGRSHHHRHKERQTWQF